MPITDSRTAAHREWSKPVRRAPRMTTLLLAGGLVMGAPALAACSDGESVEQDVEVDEGEGEEDD